MSSVLTKGIYHLNIALEYFTVFKVECKQEAKYQAGTWIKRIEWLNNDIYSALTPEAKQLFNEEIKKGDLLFHENLSENILRMNPEQRELIEKIAEGILKGEIIEYEKQ